MSAARQARGLDLEEIQEQSGISLSVLQGLETDQFDVVEPVFVRLALKEYAEYLGLDPEPLTVPLRPTATPSLPTSSTLCGLTRAAQAPA